MISNDIDIARSVELKPVSDIAAELNIPPEALHPYGSHIAKISLNYLEERNKKPPGKLVLVTAMSPTPAGEGKTTTSIGLADGLRRIGKKAVLALREPSLGPCFGVKGGATGGGRAQVAPMERINLHFTGDIHAIGAATNLLAAMADNHIYWGNKLNIDPRRVMWRRALDLNDRNLRHVAHGFDTTQGGGVLREDGFDITVASETMAVLCLADNLHDLQDRLGRIVVALDRDGNPLTAKDLQANGAMAVLLKDALMPNLAQTLEGTPAFIHGGPFANIAHGCNSIIATRAALSHGEIAVTEAGFGADLGAEKFCDITCPAGGFAPDAAVIVATIRALKMHGGAQKDDLEVENAHAVARGLPNLLRHIENMKRFGLPLVVALNHFPTDTKEEEELVRAACEKSGVRFTRATHWAEGGKGAETLARDVLSLLDENVEFAPLYGSDAALFEKAETIARTLYHAGDVAIEKSAMKKLKRWEAQGYGHLPVCMAKTPMSFSSDPKALGAPEGHTILIRDVRLSAGAGFVVALCGDIMTMPGLPKEPAANHIFIDSEGNVAGLS